MSYRDQEREKIVKIRDSLFKDSGRGIFSGKERDFVLSDPLNNLWPGIRDDAIDYFKRNRISWWKSKNKPCGHLLSSQIACINHLYSLRQREDLATSVLRSINRNIKRACVVDDGFVEFEIVGKKNYLGERHHTRGVNSTSVDALMAGEQYNGQHILIFIEWKYTESYEGESLAIERRLRTYQKFLEREDGSIHCENIEDLFFEPFYQLMRQTLLAWSMVRAKEYGATDWLHLHIIPEQNKELRDRNTSPGLKGKDMSSAWKSILKEPQRYLVISPEEFLKSATRCVDTLSLINYLNKRYW